MVMLSPAVAYASTIAWVAPPKVRLLQVPASRVTLGLQRMLFGVRCHPDMMLSVAKESLGERKRTRMEGRVGATMLCRDWGCSELGRTGVSLSRWSLSGKPLPGDPRWKKVVDEALNLWREAGSVCFAQMNFLPAGQMHVHMQFGQ